MFDTIFGDEEKMDDLFRANWILPFQWLPAEDRGRRFIEWLEDVEAKFELIEWPEETGDVKPGSHYSISISIRAKQKAKQRNQVKPAT